MSASNGSSGFPSIKVLTLSYNSQFELAHLLGFVLEFLLYGIYLCSFLVSLVIICRQARSSALTRATKIFFVSNAVLFLNATIYTGVNFSRLLGAFVWSPSGAANYLLDPTNAHWENIAFHAHTFIMMNLGDALVIYRCYIIWYRNIYVVVIPISLVLASLAFGIVLFLNYSNPNLVSTPILRKILLLVSVVHFVQNLITTTLIVCRIWIHHRNSTRAGVRSLGTSLSQIARIIIESAMIYTIELLLLIILGAQWNVYTLTLSYILVPTIGLVFNLIAARVYVAQSEAAVKPLPTSILPTIHTETNRVAEV